MTLTELMAELRHAAGNADFEQYPTSYSCLARWIEAVETAIYEADSNISEITRLRAALRSIALESFSRNCSKEAHLEYEALKGEII